MQLLGILLGREYDHRGSRIMELMTHIIDYEPSSYDEAVCQQVWKDALMESQPVVKNDVWR